MRSAALEIREVLGGGCEVKGLSQHAALNGARDMFLLRVFLALVGRLRARGSSGS